MKEQIHFNTNHLKVIAIVAMTIDHFTDLLLPGFPVHPVAISLHLVGRLTAPIMWFFICEGYYYTRNVKRYMLRLGVFALVSHFAYAFAFGHDVVPFRSGIFNQTSVMYPLFIAVLVMWLRDTELKLHKWVKEILIMFLVISAFPADWSCIAVMAIMGMYDKRGNLKEQMKTIIFWVFWYGLVSFFFVSKVYALELIGVLMVYPVLKLYNGEKGRASWMKWFFYIYYPAHLFLIGMIRLWCMGDVNLLF